MRKNQAVLFPETTDNNKYAAFVSKSGHWRSLQGLYSEGQINKKTIGLIIEAMIAWAGDPDSLCIEEFLGEKSIPWASFQRWNTMFPDLQAAYDHVKMILAGRREKGALKGELNAGMVVYSQRAYSPVWQQLAEDHAAKKNDEKGNGTSNITVVLDAIPNSPLVPEKNGLPSVATNKERA